MFSKFKNKESKATCPHCNKNLPNSILLHYFFNRFSEVSVCPHCKTEIMPATSHTKFILLQAIIVAVITMFGNRFGYVYLKLNFLQLISIALLTTAITVVILYSILYKKMKFEKV